jgi:hypothetical protein
VERPLGAHFSQIRDGKREGRKGKWALLVRYYFPLARLRDLADDETFTRSRYEPSIRISPGYCHGFDRRDDERMPSSRCIARFNVGVFNLSLPFVLDE